MSAPPAHCSDLALDGSSSRKPLLIVPSPQTPRAPRPPSHTNPSFKPHDPEQVYLECLSCFSPRWQGRHIRASSPLSPKPTLPSLLAVGSWRQQECGTASSRLSTHRPPDPHREPKRREPALNLFQGQVGPPAQGQASHLQQPACVQALGTSTTPAPLALWPAPLSPATAPPHVPRVQVLRVRLSVAIRPGLCAAFRCTSQASLVPRVQVSCVGPAGTGLSAPTPGLPQDVSQLPRSPLHWVGWAPRLEHTVTPRHCPPTAGVPCLPLFPLLRIPNLATPSNDSAWRSLPTQQGHLGAPLGSSTEDSMEKVRRPPLMPASGSGQSLDPLPSCLLPQEPVIPSQPGHWLVLRAGDAVWLLSCPLHITVAPW